MKNTWASTSALTITSLIVAWLISEIFLRSFLSIDPDQLSNKREAILGITENKPRFLEGRGIGNLVLHPYVGFVAEPDKQVNQVNRHGFLGTDPLTVIGKQHFNVAVTGGSVAGNFCGLEDVIRKDLGNEPILKGRTINLLCFAVGSHRQPQQLLSLTYFLSLGAQVDLLINIDGFNDIVTPIVHNMVYGTSLFYPTFWRDMTSGILPPNTLKHIGEVEQATQQRIALATHFHSSFVKHSALLSYAWLVFDMHIDTRAATLRSALDEEMKVLATQYFRRGPEFATDEKIARNLLAEQWARSSRLMQDLAKQNSFIYLHALQPNQYVPNTKELTGSERVSAYNPSQYRLGELVRSGYPLLQTNGKLLRNDGIRFIDATRAFFDSKNSLYIDVCCHFNKEGNNILWKIFLPQIQEALASSDSNSQRINVQ